MRPLLRRTWLPERARLYDQLAAARQTTTQWRLRADGADARHRRAVSVVWALADLAHQWAAERDAARADADQLRDQLDDVRGRCAEIRALHEDCTDPSCETRVAVADEVLKLAGDPDDPEPAGEAS